MRAIVVTHITVKIYMKMMFSKFALSLKDNFGKRSSVLKFLIYIKSVLKIKQYFKIPKMFHKTSFVPYRIVYLYRFTNRINE